MTTAMQLNKDLDYLHHYVKDHLEEIVLNSSDSKDKILLISNRFLVNGNLSEMFADKEFTRQFLKYLDSHKSEETTKIERIVQNNYFNKGNIHHTDEPCGNKCANLIKQYELVQEAKLQGVKVPFPIGISHRKIRDFLSSQAKDIFQHWSELRELYRQNHDKTDFFNQPEVKKHLEEIHHSIQAAFERAVTDEKTFSSLQLPDEIIQWLNAAERTFEFLIIRSSGLEDTRACVNAGGNISIPYVPPTKEAVCHAIGDVVASYFSPVSLQNRINADMNPFDDELHLAVLAQELISESIEKKGLEQIPKSAILFTNEPYYTGDENFRVMRLTCTYGQGASLVEEMGIGCDTVLMVQHGDQLHIFYDNREKTSRLAPVKDENTGKVSLVKVGNDPSLVNKKVFDDETLQRLFIWGLQGEGLFDGQPTDMEIVVKNNVIYPVQARPIVRNNLLPTYLDLEKIGNTAPGMILKSLPLSIITPGQASVLAIKDPSEVLFAESLTEVQEKRLIDKDKHKVVIVRKEEPPNSHPVVNFSSYGIPSFYVGDALSDMEKILNEHPSCVICTQSSMLHIWNGGDVEAFTSKGFVVHPAKIAHSFTEEPSIHPKKERAEKADEVKKILLFMTTSSTNEAALQILKQIKKEGPVQAFKAKRLQLQELNDANQSASHIIGPHLDTANRLESKLKEVFKELKQLMKNPSSGRMHTLFYVKALEGLLENKNVGIGQHSVASMNTQFSLIDEQLAYQNKLGFPAHFANEIFYGSQSPVPEIKGAWQDFLLRLEPLINEGHHDIERDLKSLLEQLKKFDMLPLFMTFFFPQTVDKNPLEQARKLLSLLPKNEIETIEAVRAANQKIKNLRDNVELFSDPKTLEQGISLLNEACQDLIPGKNTPLSLKLGQQEWKKLSPLARSAILQNMQELVDAFDLSIKTTKKSLQFEGAEKIKAFKRLVRDFSNLFEQWSKHTVGENEIIKHKEWGVKRYLELLFEKYEAIPETNAQLHPSSGFSVSGALITSSTNLERHLPRTIEDYFTLAHQNALDVISLLTMNLFPMDILLASPLPDNFKKAILESNMIGGGEVGGAKPIGIHITASQVNMKFNVPLRNHSSIFSLNYDPLMNKDEIQLKISFLGEARGRWFEGALMAEILDNKQGMLVSAPEVNNLELNIAFRIKKEKDIATFYSLYHIIAQLSLRYDRNEKFKYIDLLKSLDFEKIDWYDTYRNTKSDKLESNKKFVIELIQLLIKSGEKSLYKAAEQIIEDAYQHPALRAISLDLVHTLVDKEESFVLGIEKASQTLLDGKAKDDQSSTALYIFLSLFEHKLGFNEAKSVIEELIKQEDPNKIHYAISLLLSLLSQDQGYDLAVKVVEIALNSDKSYIKEAGITIYKILLNQGKGNEVISIIKQFYEEPNKQKNSNEKEKFEMLAKEFLKKNEGSNRIKIKASVNLLKEFFEQHNIN